MEKLTPGRKIYFAFYETKKGSLYYNQLKGHAGFSDSSLQNALKKLKENREIEAIKQKANTFYRLKNKNKIKYHFTSFDYNKLENLSNDIKIPLKRFLSEKPKSTAFIILFGSASRKHEKKGSDIDILVILNSFEDKKLQKQYETEMKAIFENLREKINASSIYPLSIFYADINAYLNEDDRVIVEAKKTGFCIDGNLEYYEVMLNELEN